MHFTVSSNNQKKLLEKYRGCIAEPLFKMHVVWFNNNYGHLTMYTARDDRTPNKWLIKHSLLQDYSQVPNILRRRSAIEVYRTIL